MLSYLEALNIQGVTPEKLASSFDQSELNHLDLGQCQLNPAGVRRLLQSHGVDYSPRIMAYTSLKGGTGKTTSSVTTAVRAVDYGFRPCILDLDSQGSATLALGVLPNEDDAVFVDVWQKPSEHIPQALRAHPTGVSILPSSLDNSLLDVQLVNPNAQKNAVRDVCSVIFENGFDLIVIDCPPSLGTAVISTICAANMVVIPTNSDQFSLKAVELTIQEIKAICETFGLPIPLVKVLYTKFDRRIRLAHDMLDLLSKRYPEQLIVPPIRTSSEYAKQLQVQKTVFSGRRKSVARDDYDSFIRALFQLRISDSPQTSSPVEDC